MQIRTSVFPGSTSSPPERRAATFRLQTRRSDWRRNLGNARQQGRPTADAKDLDIDVILAAQALSFGPAPSDVVVTTSNPKHLSQFITAQNWNEILP